MKLIQLPRFSSLHGRIFSIFWLTILLVVVVIIMGAKLDPRRLHDVPKQFHKQIQTQLADISDRYKNSESLTLAADDFQKQEKRKGISYILMSEEGDWLQSMTKTQLKVFNHFDNITQEATVPKQRLYGRRMVVGPMSVTMANQPVKLFVSIRWREPPPFLLQLLDRPWQMLIAVMIVSTPLLLWLSWALSQPAVRLEKASQKVARGQFEIDPDLEKGTSEFQQAGKSFNQMVLAINNMMVGQRRLLSDISHELRTPLTRLRMANALAIRKQGESAELKRIDTETERLENMINALLELSRNQANSYEVRQNITAKDIWEEMLLDAQFEAEQLNKSVTFNSIPACQLTGTPYLLTSAVENVIRNGLKYCQTNVNVTFKHEKQTLRITIDDDGDGVDEHELNAIFRPFYRVGEARDRDTGGAGLGLAITQNVIEQHNGRIEPALNSQGGLSITVILPLN